MKMFDTEQQGAAGAKLQSSSRPYGLSSSHPGCASHPHTITPAHQHTNTAAEAAAAAAEKYAMFAVLWPPVSLLLLPFPLLCSSCLLLLVWPLGANLKIIYNDVTSV